MKKLLLAICFLGICDMAYASNLEGNSLFNCKLEYFSVDSGRGDSFGSFLSSTKERLVLGKSAGEAAVNVANTHEITGYSGSSVSVRVKGVDYSLRVEC